MRLPFAEWSEWQPLQPTASWPPAADAANGATKRAATTRCRTSFMLPPEGACSSGEMFGTAEAAIYAEGRSQCIDAPQAAPRRRPCLAPPTPTLAPDRAVARARGPARFAPVIARPWAVLLDLDGTIVDTVPFILESVRHAFAGRARSPSDAEWIAGIGSPLRVQLRAFAADAADVEALVARYRE